MDSPIEKITDPSFTSSAKGLMTLFSIGLIHVVVGIKLDKTQITIPWFPEITFQHTDRLIYLYWALVLYAIYRYVLHHKSIFGMYSYESLANILQIGQKGESIVRKFIYLSEDYYKVSKRKSDDNLNIIDVEAFVDEPTEVAFCFSFYFKEDYSFLKIKCWENSGYDTSSLVVNHKEINAKWGLKDFVDESGYSISETSRIVDLLLRVRLRFFVIRYYFKEMTFNKDIFDTTVPIALNISLFAYWLASSIYKHYFAMV